MVKANRFIALALLLGSLPVNAWAQSTGSHVITQAEAQDYCDLRLSGADAQRYCVDLILGNPTEDACAKMNAPFGMQVDDRYIAACAVQNVANRVARDAHTWFDRLDYVKGLPRDEASVVKTNGIPCHVETYNGGSHYLKETFWYCDSEGSYTNSFSFVNGKLTSTYTP